MRTVGARQTELRALEDDEALSFVKANHRQGVARTGGNLKSYGLYYGDELLAVALFCNPRTSQMQRRYTTELLRLAFKTGVRMPGGASKLIKHFLSTGPWDLFTYQSTSGEATDVYLHAGLALVSEAVPKDVLVRDGVTLDSAKDNRKDWFSIEQVVTLGPDALLGIKLGEQFRENGVRKSNIDLFLEHCGYHIEQTAGDRVYEWRNPDISFYTYKITAKNDPGYYFGRHMLRTAAPTVDECLRDGYMGSGGKKFQEWVNGLDSDSLQKEIIGVYSDWASVVKAERELIGELHLTDPNCKNFQPGGMGLGKSVARLIKDTCPVHGETLFNGKACLKCASAKSFTTRECPIHGSVLFRGDTCETCIQNSRWSTGNCSTHGEVKLVDGKCINCRIASSLSLKTCAIHGETIHFGASCATCSANSAVTMKDCSIHGFTKHQGAVCSRCNSTKSVSQRTCAIHGETTHQGTICMKCNSKAQFATKSCATHGEVLFKGDACTLCTAQKAISLKECAIHGLVKHQGDVCNSCNSSKSVSLKECSIHGLTKHQGAVCNRCNAQDSVKVQLCVIHGESKFQGDTCVKCRNGALIKLKNCPTHGETKHRGDSCYACASDRRKAKKTAAV
jgi:hypothetical protein